MSPVDVLCWTALILAGFPAVMYYRNVLIFSRLAGRASDGIDPLNRRLRVRLTEPISVLIPARNEELGIRQTLEAILANVDVELEVIVLDDHSTDRTADIVRSFTDPRVRLETAPPLPAGWTGKQHACYVLSQLAKYETITFLDADVRLSPDALMNMHGFLQLSGSHLVSGFPRQITGSFWERLLIPLIHWVLLSFLSLDAMRRFKLSGFGAGCGQWFMTTRIAYNAVGGHSHPLVRASWHDGIKLPQAYRKCGYRTDLCDATHDASCRMYRSGSQVWNGLAKNAREGLGSPKLVLLWTILLLGNAFLPWVLLPFASGSEFFILIAAIILSYLPRVHSCLKFQQSRLGALLHPLGVLSLIAIQWYSNFRVWIGRPIGWRGRVQ